VNDVVTGSDSAAPAEVGVRRREWDYERVRRRDDLQGLRAVAVLLVVLSHAGLPFLGGGYVGVDVFFVLSGFLITGLLLSQARRDGRVRLGDFYVRRARRILPAAVLTLVATDIAAHQLLNFVRARDAVHDSVWAAFFSANVHFARVGSDYFAQAEPPSPVQHFWTLAVEEQFYLVWPVVLALALLVAPLRRRLLWIVVAVGAASLAWSVHATAADQASTYFSTGARAWELALGAALAIGALRLPPLAGWLGLACIVAAGLAFSGSTPFPGYAALLPTIGAALVIAAREGGASRMLSVAPMRYVGDRSYAFYLWHWPVLVLAAGYAGHEQSMPTRLGLLVSAFLLSIVTYAAFENPIRHMKWRAPTGALLWPASAAVILAVALPILASLDSTATRIASASAAVRPEALVKETGTARTSWKPLPAVAAAVAAAKRNAALPWPLTPPVGSLRSDFYEFPKSCSAHKGQTTSRICRLGEPDAAKTLVVFGDSHAEMWMPAVLRMAHRDAWAVVPFVKVGCVPSSWTHRSWPCGVWYRWAINHAAALHPQASLLVGSWAGSQTPAAAVKGMAKLIGDARRFSASTIVVGDSPHQHRGPVDCLLARGSTMRTCSSRATLVELQTDAAVATAAARQRVGFVNVTGWFCGRASSVTVLCPLVVNKTISWIDHGHISATYGAQLATPFRNAFRRELFR
jgi:peptidoglycan/LPS O-acetylase OafA/YrhL